MPSREAMIDTMDRLYRARVAGDKDALAQVWAPGATYRMAGGATAMPDRMRGSGPARPATEQLIDTFVFHTAERLETVVEGDTAATRMRCEVTRKGSERHVETEIMDLWTFNSEGRVQSIVQYIDTALMLELLGA